MHAWTYISNTYKYIHIYTKWIKTLRTAYPYGLNDHNGELELQKVSIFNKDPFWN